jgi:NAD(P)-dependent dehydrogenase (short-subunit alcohol dehydrogenase family)
VDLNLKGRRALVTGSTAGIGLAIATSLAREGGRVIVTGRTQTGVTKTVADVQASWGLRVTSARPQQPRTSFAVIPTSKYWSTTLAYLSPSHSSRFQTLTGCGFEVNVLSGVRLARFCLPTMRRANWGRIIFISSESALQIPVEMIHYGVTKTAQIALARGLAEAVAGTGITVNSVLAGPTKSRGVVDFVGALTQGSGKSFEEFEAEFFEKVRPTSLIKRFAAPEEVASLVTYIASPLASATTGAALRVDGGVVKSPF